jgi:hypothetical protein
MLIVRLRANTPEDIKRCNGDMFVIPNIAGPGGIRIRYGLYRLMVDGLHCYFVSSVSWVLRINACIAICCCCVVISGSSQLRGNCTCPPGSACYNRISCNPAHVATPIALWPRPPPPCVDSALYSPFPLVLWRALLGGRTEHQVLECSQYS